MLQNQFALTFSNILFLFKLWAMFSLLTVELAVSCGDALKLLQCSSALNYPCLAYCYDLAVMCLSHFCWLRVTSLSSQSHLKCFRVRSETSHYFVELTQNRVTRTVDHFEWLVCKLESVSSHVKFHIFPTFFCYEMAPKLLKNDAWWGKNGAQCILESVIASYLYLCLLWKQCAF